MLLGDLENVVIFRVDNTHFEPLGLLNQVSKVDWGKRFSDYYEFQIVAPIIPENIELLSVGNIVYVGNHNAGIIDIAEVARNEQGQMTMTIKGKTLEALLDLRVVEETHNFKNAKTSSVMYSLVEEKFVNPIEVKRVLPYFECEVDEEVGAILTIQRTGGTVLDVLKDINAIDSSIGFEVQFLPESQKIKFVVFKTENHNKFSEYPVIFSDTTEDIISDSYYHNTRDKKNLAYVAGEYADYERVMVIQGDQDVEGFERRELYVDARDLQQDDGEEALTDEEYRNVLKSRGAEKLGEMKELKTFEGNLRLQDNPRFTFGVDYNLGDIVTVIDEELGVTTDAVVSCLQEIVSQNYEPKITLGYELPSLAQKIKNMR